MTTPFLLRLTPWYETGAVSQYVKQKIVSLERTPVSGFIVPFLDNVREIAHILGIMT